MQRLTLASITSRCTETKYFQNGALKGFIREKMITDFSDTLSKNLSAGHQPASAPSVMWKSTFKRT